MRGVKHEFGMLFTHEGRLTRHIRAPKQQRQARASTGKLGRIRWGKKGFDGPWWYPTKLLNPLLVGVFLTEA